MKHKEWAIPQGFLAILCAVLILVFSGYTFAQVETGSVTGTVMDQTGAIVQKAQCTLTNVNTGITQKAISTSAGAYTFASVQVGTYNLTVEAKGFETYALTNLVVHVATTETEDVTLKVGAQTEKITVTSAAPLLQAQDASLGMTVDNTAATELPLFGGGSGRNFMDLTTIAPGVQYTGSNLSTNTFLIHGVQSGAIDVRINGADDNDEVFGGVAIAPIPDSIQEFKLQSGDNSAELGEFYGSVVNVTTRSGGNKFHGRAWEYNENDGFGIANDYFNKLHQLVTNTTHVPNRPARFKENSYGGYFSGPVLVPGYNGRNKTFFFVDYQRTKYVAASANNNYTVPTTGMESSNFKDLSDMLKWGTTSKNDGLGRTFQIGTILDPATTRAVAIGTVDPVTGLTAACTASGAYCPTINGTQYAVVRDPYFQAPGSGCPSLIGTTNWVSDLGATGGVPHGCFNQIPSGRLDSNAVTLLGLMPKPNQNQSATGTYQNNYNATIPQPQTTPQWDIRVDHTFSARDTLFGTYSHWNHTTPGFLPLPGVLEGGGSISAAGLSPTNMVVLTETHVFNPSLINDFRFAWQRQHSLSTDPGAWNTTYGLPAQYGIPGIPQTAENGGLPQFNISNLISFGAHQNNTNRYTGAWRYVDSLTKTVGRHEWKFGGEYMWTFGNISQINYPRGNFSYNGMYSNVPNSGDSVPAMADFLLTPAAYGANSNGSNYASANPLSVTGNLIGSVNSFAGNNYAFSTYGAPYVAFYAMDSWKITPSLTASVGLRYDYFGPYYSKGGQEANLWMGGKGDDPNGAAFHVAHDGCATTMSPYFRGLLAYDNIPIICEPNNAANKTPRANWAPRVGLAYRVRPNLVVRIGGGLAYGAFNSIGYSGTLGQNYPFRYNISSGSSNNAYTPQLIGATSATTGLPTTTATIENLFSIIDLTNASNAALPLGGLALYGRQYHEKIPYVTTTDAAVQYQFTSHDSVEVRYIGQYGVDLESGDPYNNAARELIKPNTTIAPNVPQIGACAPYCATSVDNTIPFPNLTHPAGPMWLSEQISNYQSGEAEYQHQFAAGFNMDANYTYTGCLTDAQGGQQNESPANGRAPWVVGFGGYRADYDRCSNTATHIFHLSGEFGLPFGQGAHWAHNVNKATDEFIGGWKLDPIWIASSGVRANISCQGTIGGIANAPGNFTGPWFATGDAWACDAPKVSGAHLYGPGPQDQPKTRITGYWNSAAFTAPVNPVLTNGQQDMSPLGARGNQLNGPGFYDIDLAIHKQFRTTEHTNLEVQAQAMNFFNHVQLNNPGTSNYTQPNKENIVGNGVAPGGFGEIGGDRFGSAGRVMQFVAKFSF